MLLTKAIRSYGIFLFILTRFTGNVFYMQLLNIFLMSFCVYLFLRHAPFKKIISVLIVFGYFFIFEYHVISRNYALSVLLLTLVFIQISKPVKNHYLTALFILLLSLSHLYSLIIASALCLILVFLNRENKIRNIYGALLLINILIVYSLRVPADHFLFKYDHDAFFSFKRIGKAFSIYLKGIFPVPDLSSAKLWNSNFMVAFSKTLGTILSFVLLLIPFYIFRKNRIVLFFFYFSSLLICSFIYFSPMIVSTRHCGFIFVTLIFSFWLQKIIDPAFSIKNVLYERAAIAVLVLHVFSGAYLFTADIRQRFSNSKELVNFIKNNHLENKKVFLSNLSSGPSVSAYLNKKINYLETGQQSSFCKWNTWPFILTEEQFCKKLNQQIIKDSCLLILNLSYLENYLGGEIESKLPKFTMIKLASFDEAMLPSENYNLYYILKK